MNTHLQGRNVLFITANTGIERDELLKPMQALTEQGANVTHASLKGGQAQTWLKDSEKDVSVQSDKPIAETNAAEYDLLVIPGGTVNADTLRQDVDAQRLVQAFRDAGKPVAAICHGPWLLIDAGVVAGKVLTSYASVRTDLVNAGAEWVDAPVQVCPGQNWTLITSRKPDDLSAFNEELGKALRVA
jgi:protease I